MRRWCALALAAVVAAMLAVVLFIWTGMDMVRPSATISIDGREQKAETGTFCWTGLVKGMCSDAFGHVTPRSPLTVKLRGGPLKATLTFSKTPTSVLLRAFPVASEDELQVGGGGVRVWRDPPGDSQSHDLLPIRQQEVELALQPGLYVVNVFTRWGRGDISYGFLLEVAEA